MKVAIFGVDQVSQIVAQIIEQVYNPFLEQKLGEKLDVVSFLIGGGQAIPPNVGAFGNAAILNPVQFAALYHKKLVDKIIFTREISNEKELFALRMMNVKIEDIYLSNRLDKNLNVINFLEPYVSAKYLPYLEFRIADHCNMNCKACVDYAALVTKPHFANLENFIKDFEQLHKFIDDIKLIRIMGGEPLLNPEVCEYVKLSRRLYPLANIVLVTNGLLIPKMSDEFFDTLRTCNVRIQISLYPPMATKIDSVKKIMDDKHVGYHIITDNNNPITKFFINQTLKPHDREREIFYTCGSANCHNLWEGKLLACPRPSAVKFFNDYYHKNLPTNSGIIDLYEKDLTTEKLKTTMITPFELCKYCTPRFWIKWATVKHPSPLSDWVVEESIENQR